METTATIKCADVVKVRTRAFFGTTDLLLILNHVRAHIVLSRKKNGKTSTKPTKTVGPRLTCKSEEMRQGRNSLRKTKIKMRSFPKRVRSDKLVPLRISLRLISNCADSGWHVLRSTSGAIPEVLIQFSKRLWFSEYCGAWSLQTKFGSIFQSLLVRLHGTEQDDAHIHTTTFDPWISPSRSSLQVSSWTQICRLILFSSKLNFSSLSMDSFWFWWTLCAVSIFLRTFGFHPVVISCVPTSDANSMATAERL